MSQIIVKENEKGIQCLFDTRSEKFFLGGCIRKQVDHQFISDLASYIASKTPKAIYGIVQAAVYDAENGYLNYMIARDYLDLNPDIKDQALKALEKIKLRRQKKEQAKKDKKEKTNVKTK